MSRGAAIIDEYVRLYVIDRLTRPDAVDLMTDQAGPDLQSLRDQASAIRQRLDELAELAADPAAPLTETNKAIMLARRRLADIQTEMADGVAFDILGPLIQSDDIGAAWGVYSLDQQRAVIDALMTVTLGRPGRGARTFDPGTIIIEPKGRN